MDSEEVGLSWGQTGHQGSECIFAEFIHLSTTFSFFALLAQQEVSHFGLFQEQEQ